MAINPGTLFPLKMIPASSPDWPYGEPKDVLVAGDGTGTPWIVEICKDIMGFQQALLIRGGVTPTGTPETANASQYYDALTKLFSRSVETTAALRAGKHPNVAAVETAGFATAGDGGGAFWIATGGPTGTPGTENFAAGVCFDDDGREFAIVDGAINPRSYGAVGNGVADDVVPIQNAMDTQAARVGGPVHLSAGTYLCSAQITGKDKVTFHGDGVGATTLSWAGAGGSFPDLACLWATGSSSILPALSIAVAPGETTITFAAVHGLAVGDLITITDDRSSSYSIDSALSKAGEFFVVAEVPTTTTIVTETPAFATTSIVTTGTDDTYSVANCTLYKVTPVEFAIRDMTIVGRATSTRVVRTNFARRCSFERLVLTSSTAAMIRAEHSFDMSFADLVMYDPDPTASEGVGIQIVSCQRIFMNRVRGGGSTAMLDASRDGLVTSVVNRQLYIDNCYAPQHGDGRGSIRVITAEYMWVSNSTVAGLRLGGDHFYVSNSLLEGQVSSTAAGIGEGWALYFLNMTGFDVRVDGCRIVARVNVAPAAALVYWADAVKALDRPAQAEISNTEITLDGFTGQPMRLTTNTVTLTPSIKLQSVTVFGPNIVSDTVQIDHTTGAGWKRIVIQSCRFRDLGFRPTGAQLVLMQDTVVERSPEHGVAVVDGASNPFSARTIQVQGCQFIDNWDSGIISTVKDATMNVYSCWAINNNRNPSKLASRSSVVCLAASGGTAVLNMIGNVIGDDQTVQSQINSSNYGPNVDSVVDANNVTLGGLTSSGTPIAITISNQYDQDADNTLHTGTLGIVDGDPDSAPTGATDFAIGDGIGNRGMYFNSASSGESSIVMGDSGDADRLKIVGDHANNRFTFTANSVASLRIDAGGMNPVTTNIGTIGESLLRYEAIYGGRVHVKRMFLDNGTIVVSGSHLSLNANWGVGASFDGLTAGRDGVVRVVIDSGSSATGANAEFTYTFPDGASSSQIPYVFLTNRGGPISRWDIVSTSSTAVVVRFDGTPVINTEYGVNLLLVWSDD